jgi:prepilin-type N-terminal cleavage/methylation domain-containing protein
MAESAMLSAMGSHRGTTLVELVVVLIVVGALAGIALPRFRRSADRFAVRAAIQETRALFTFARRAAITRRAVVGVITDTSAVAIIVRSGGVELARRSLRERYGVRLTATRDSMSYDPRGLGYGAANLTIVARRGQGAETLFVSRLGRTRR